VLNKNNNKLNLLILSIATAVATLFHPINSVAEINDKGGVFFYSDNLQIGINKHAAFGSDKKSGIAPYNNAPNKLGFISDPNGNQFTSSYDGDFFMPDTTESGWGIRFNETDYHNSRNYQYDSGLASIVGSFSNFQNTGDTQEVTWTGNIDNKLDIKQIFSVYQKGLTAIVDIELTNNTAEVMNDVYYMQTVDPDNNYQSSDEPIDLKTTNSVIAQGDTNGMAVVSARQKRQGGDATGHSEVKLIGYAKNARVTYGGKTNRNPVDVYTGTAVLKNTGSDFIDESISLVFKYDEIAPGDTVKFKLAYQISDSDIPQIDLDKNDSSNATSDNAYKSIFIAGGTATEVVDSDIKITVANNANLQGVEILLITPHTNDFLSVSASLPTGIEIDTTRTTDTKLILTGEASAADYETALKLVRYANTAALPKLAERIINILILDNIYTLSNAAQAQIGVVMPVTIVGSITSDNIVNVNEKGHVSATGQASPNLDVALVFTDKNGKTVTASSPANTQGSWDSSNAQVDITSLVDGEITLTATTTDTKGYTSTANKVFEKDTTIADTIILKPVIDELLAGTDLLVSGTADPKASLEVKVDDDHTCTTTVDTDGKWSCSIANLVLDTEYPLEVIATDDAGNTKKVTSSFSTPPLTLEILNPQDKATVANSSPLIAGTSLANSSIIVSIAGKSCSTTTNSSGNWSCSLDNLPTGDSQDLVVVTEVNDGTKKSKSIQINVPSTPLLISSPQQNTLLSSSQINIEGTSDPLAKITVSTGIDGETCNTIADSSGNWSCSFKVKEATTNKTLSIESELAGISKKVATVVVRYEVLADKKEDGVTSVLKGSGSSSPFILLLIGLGIFLTRKILNKKY